MDHSVGFPEYLIIAPGIMGKYQCSGRRSARINNYFHPVKVKVTLEQATKAQRGEEV
jgi:hypothetical protein